MKELGDRGERVAEKFLRRRGYRILARNYRCPCGELDIIARDGDVIAFIEVKGRSSEDFGGALEAITEEKKRRMGRTAIYWMSACGLERSIARFDVVGIGWGGEGRAETVLVKDAFRLAR